MMFSTQKKNVHIYSVEICDVRDNYVVSAEVTRVDREVLLTLQNPRYEEVKRNYNHLSSIMMDDVDEKDELQK